MEKTINIALVGVGGQGTLLASNVIARTAMLAGFDVKKSEIHGMAQRGGSVVSQVRIGKKIYSPQIPEGETDVLVSFEMLESVRYADWVKPDGFALINRQIITPVTVSSGQQPWIEDLDARIEKAYPRHLIVDALKMAEDFGNIKVTNMILTGALSGLLDIEGSVWEQAVAELVPAKFKELNLKAFAAGRELTFKK